MLSLHNLPKNKSHRSTGKRRGRGNASGAGNYSGRGIKGQRARSGGRVGLAVKSIKSYLLRIPKVRGFKSFYAKLPVVNTGDLNRVFKDGDRVNHRALLKAGLLPVQGTGFKVLAKGVLHKKLTVEAPAFSKSAAGQITKAGGQVIVLGASVDKKDQPDQS